MSVLIITWRQSSLISVGWLSVGMLERKEMAATRRRDRSSCIKASPDRGFHMMSLTRLSSDPLHREHKISFSCSRFAAHAFTKLSCKPEGDSLFMKKLS